MGNKLLLEIEESKLVLEELDFFLTQIREKYGEEVIDQLVHFEGNNILKHYLTSAYDINKRKNYANEQNYKMDHFLYKIMKHHAFSLFDLQHYNPKGKPHNLESSYGLSASIANDIEDTDGNIAWFSNMKLPTTYLGSDEVDTHYNDLWDCGLLQRPNVDVRRIHIYFEDFNKDSKDKETEALFTVLILEFLLGINSRVLIIDNYNSIKDKILSLKNTQNADIISVFLLDFALYFQKSINSNTHLPGNYFSLCSDFVFEDLNDVTANLDERKERYSNEKVFEFHDPKIFSILKYYYLSTWNKDKYVNFLESQHPKLFINNEIFKTGLIDILKNNFKVLDLFQFWRHMKNNNVTELFNLSYFIRFYPYSIMDPTELKDYTYKLLELLRSNNISNRMEINKIKDKIIKELRKGNFIKREIFESQNIN